MTGVATRGLDVSHYQGAVDWAGATMLYHLTWGAAKATEGASFTDDQFGANWLKMRRAGLSRIAYHYARPESSSALSQATRFVNAVNAAGGLRPGLDALCLDLEASNLNQSQTNAWMIAFGAALRKLAPGVATICYIGSGYAGNGTGRDASGAFDRWWFPRYASTGLAKAWPAAFAPQLSGGNTTGWAVPPAPHVWQWTPNLAGRDANVSDLSLAELFTPGAATPTTPTPTVEDDPMFLVSVKGQPDQYLSNGMSRRGVVSDTYRQFLIDRGCDPLVHEFDTVSGMNAGGGPLAADSWRYDAATAAWTPPPAPSAAPSADEVAAAVVALLPDPSTGLTPDQVVAAVKQALREGVAA